MKKLSRKGLFNKAWKLTSEVVRRKGIKGDYNYCFTCLSLHKWQDLHAGHFKNGKSKRLYFDLRNLRPQCNKCNTYLNGNRDVFAYRILKTEGEKELDFLMKHGVKDHYFSNKELKEIIATREKELNLKILI